MRPLEFAELMQLRLWKNRHFDHVYAKSGERLEEVDGWMKDHCGFEHLVSKMAEHCGEINGLMRVLVNGRGKEKLVVRESDIENLCDQCADVANYAMMIADRARRRKKILRQPVGEFTVD